jgi:subtilisin family serine protease
MVAWDNLKELKMKAANKESLMNGKINPQAEELADLPVTVEQGQHAKGGRSSLDPEGHGTHVAGTIGAVGG